MDSNMMWELIGYLGSALVLVSLLMSSIVKLRIVNAIGSLIFCIYAFKINSIPTAVMNICLVGIDLYFLRKLSIDNRVFSYVRVNADDAAARHLLDMRSEDVSKYFDSGDISDADEVLLAFDGDTMAGVLAGVSEGDTLRILIDYTTPQYRDCKVGRFLHEALKERYKRVIYSGNNKWHIMYVEKMGYEKTGEEFVKTL